MNIEDLRTPWRQFVTQNSFEPFDRHEVAALLQEPVGSKRNMISHMMRQASLLLFILMFCQSC